MCKIIASFVQQSIIPYGLQAYVESCFRVYNLLWIRRVDSELNIFAFLGYFKINTLQLKQICYKDEFDTQKSYIYMCMIHLSSLFGSLQWTNKVG